MDGLLHIVTDVGSSIFDNIWLDFQNKGYTIKSAVKRIVPHLVRLSKIKFVVEQLSYKGIL